MSKIKLAYVTHGLSSNGIESFLVNIVNRIDMSKYDVTFVVAIDKDTIPLHEKTVVDSGASVIKICDLDSMQKKVTYIKTLEKVFREGKYDIVHANMDLLNGLVLRAAKKAGIQKRICHAHTTASTFSADNSGNIFLRTVQKLYHSVMRFLILKNSTHLLGCSDAANKYMYSKSSAKAQIINNGIDISRFSRKNNPNKSDLINIVTVGRLSSPKNPLFLIDIIEQLSAIRTDFIFKWVGDGEMSDEIHKKIEAKDLGKFIELLGLRTDIPQILSNCSYFLLPSIFEGLPVSLVEAQASGLECFVSSVVTKEVDLGACHFIPLDIGAKGWADFINKTINNNNSLKVDPDKLIKFDISYTVNQLNKVYSSK